MSALLETRDLSVLFYERRSVLGRVRGSARPALRALDGVNLAVQRGASVGVVGESGCGKTTLARALIGLVEPTSGQVCFEGEDLSTHRDKNLRRRIQMVFQDPSSSLNPRMTVGQCLSELLRVHELVPPSQIRARSVELLELVELQPGILDVTPRRLSGGQRQRVAIARALAVEPEVLIADEAVAALDVSVQAAVLNLLSDLRDRLDLTLMFISHDLAVVRSVCDRVVVMYMGRVVEAASTETLFTDPRHPYTRALLAAAPRIDVRRRAGEAALQGEPHSPMQVPSGCRFHPRCPVAVNDLCAVNDPVLRGTAGHEAACHFAWDPSCSDPEPCQ